MGGKTGDRVQLKKRGLRGASLCGVKIRKRTKKTTHDGSVIITTRLVGKREKWERTENTELCNKNVSRPHGPIHLGSNYPKSTCLKKGRK